MSDKVGPLVGALNAIDFGNIIGGPLTATISAQSQAAIQTLSFITDKVFMDTEGDSTTMKNASFTYTKTVGTGGSAKDVTQTLKVPLLSLAPIPYIRVSHLLIDFNVKLHATNSQSYSNDTVKNTDESNGHGFFSFLSSSRHHVTVSNRLAQKANTVVNREYSMNVRVRAVQDGMPRGLAKVLGIFEEALEHQVEAQTNAQDTSSGSGTTPVNPD